MKNPILDAAAEELGGTVVLDDGAPYLTIPIGDRESITVTPIPEDEFDYRAVDGIDTHFRVRHDVGDETGVVASSHVYAVVGESMLVPVVDAIVDEAARILEEACA